MTNWLAAGLIGLYAVITLAAPVIWAKPRLINRYPRTVLWGWALSLLLASVSLVAALVVLIQRSLRHEFDPIPNGVWLGPLVDTLLGWASIAALGLLLFRAGVAVSELRAALRTHETELTVLSTTGDNVTVSGINALRVTSSIPLMASIAKPRRIVFTTSLEQALSAEQLHAALVHEREHLRGRHSQLRALSTVATAVAPSFRSSTELARATRIATELAADDAAARECGDAIVADALTASFPRESFIDERVERLRLRNRPRS